MQVIRKRIDQRSRRSLRHLLQVVVGISAPDNGLHVAGQDRTRILIGLALTHMSARRINGNGAAAHVRNSGFKGKAGACRCLIKKDGYRLWPLQRAPRERVGLELDRQIEDFLLFLWAQVIIG